MKANSWASLYSARRRAIDKAILQECERRIAAEEEAAKPTSLPRAVNPVPHRNTAAGSSDFDMRLTISRAFGRPLA